MDTIGRRYAPGQRTMAETDSAPIVTLGDKQAADLLEAYANFISRNTRKMQTIQPGIEADIMIHAADSDLILAQGIAANLRKTGDVKALIAALNIGGSADNRITAIVAAVQGD